MSSGMHPWSERAPGPQGVSGAPGHSLPVLALGTPEAPWGGWPSSEASPRRCLTHELSGSQGFALSRVAPAGSRGQGAA